VTNEEPPLSELEGEEFIQSLKDMGGFQEELLQDAMVMEFFEPILKADFRAIENYTYEETPLFQIPITVMIGADEEVTNDEAWSWKKESTEKVEVKVFPGHHFFIFDQAPAVMELISSRLQNIIPNRPFDVNVVAAKGNV
jgi:surfactin synthase thioesterase subunit